MSLDPPTSAGAIASIAGIQNNTHPCWWRDPGLRKLNFFIASQVGITRDRRVGELTALYTSIYLSSALFGYDGAVRVSLWGRATKLRAD